MLLVEDATHVAKFELGDKLTHATRVNTETIKTNKLTHATELTYVRKLAHLHAKRSRQATAASCVIPVCVFRS